MARVRTRPRVKKAAARVHGVEYEPVPPRGGDAVRCVGFRTMLIRDVAWAAVGKVSLPMPDDFPTASEIKLRSDDVPSK